MIFVIFITLIIIYFYASKKIRLLCKSSITPLKNTDFKYTTLLIIVNILVALFISLFIGNFITDQFIKYYIINFSNLHSYSNLPYEAIKESLRTLPVILDQHPNLNTYEQVSFYLKNSKLLELYKNYKMICLISNISMGIISVITSIIIINKIYSRLIKKLNAQYRFENIIKKFLFVSCFITIIATLAIIASLLWETILFFEKVPLLNFLFGTKWAPQNSSINISDSFGILPLLGGTFLIAIIACIVSLIIGIPAAIYMSEFMPMSIKNFVKPMLEILSGIPTIVYGFFASLILGPNLVHMFSFFNVGISNEAAIISGIVIGVMIIPFISSSTDDIISAIPKSTREAGYALGSMQYEVVCKILLPISMPGILSSFLLAFSRAIGETMIVVMASGLVANLTFNPFASVTTITTQIVTIAQGDQDFLSIQTLSLFALGFTLFCVTLLLNLFSFWVIKKFQRKW